MKAIIEKAAVLIEALPYIQSFKNKYVVIKYGGSAMVNNDYSKGILRDIVFMESVGMYPILVFGGGSFISQKMRDMGKTPNFIEGLRVTDDDTIKIAEQVLVNEVGANIVKTIAGFGGQAKAISGRVENLIEVRKKPPLHEINGKKLETPIDLGYVGEVTKVNPEPIKQLCLQDIVPVIAPIGIGPDGNPYNINADVAAAGIAQALRAEKLVYLSDVKGIMIDPADESSLVSHIQIEDVENLISKGVISGGMIPKVRSSMQAIKSGVKKTHIIDGRTLHSMLLEIYTDKGVGTEIVSKDATNV